MTSSLAQRIRDVLALDPTAQAIVFGADSYPWSYISRVVSGLDKALGGFEESSGSAIGLIMRNRPAHIAILGASIASDRCLVTLSPMYSDRALAEDIRGSDLIALVGEPQDLLRPGVLDAARESGCVVLSISNDIDQPLEIVRTSRTAWRSKRRPGVVLEMLSSGTTGNPKRIPLSINSIESSLRGGDGKKKADEEIRLQERPALVWHPIVHISGAYFVIDALNSGRMIVLLERFDTQVWADSVEREGVRVGHLNPTTMRMLLESSVRPEQLSSLKVIRGGTGATPPDLQLAFEERFHVPVLTTYGATEFAGAVVGWSMEDYRAFGRSHLGASGRAHEGVELRTVDSATGEIQQIGEEGILEVRTSQASVDPSKWVRTTDIAVIDVEGFLWVKGRADDAIIRGGFKVHPAKIEAALEEHPFIYEAAVVGLPDERLGAVPVAVVTTVDDAPQLEVEILLEFLRERLTAYEVPSELLIVEEIPRTPSLKVSRPGVRAFFNGQSS